MIYNILKYGFAAAAVVFIIMAIVLKNKKK